jgi:hypothetical protein
MKRSILIGRGMVTALGRQRLRSYLHKIHAGASRNPSPLMTRALRVDPRAWSDRPLIPKDGQEIDILLPLGAGSKHGDAELRFALRSIERHAMGFRRIVIVGKDPGFLSGDDRIRHVPCGEFGGNHEARIALKLAWAFENAELSEWAVLWNDDYICQRPVDVRTFGFLHKGRLEASVASRRRDRYRSALWITSRYLESCGFPSYHYDIHYPMIYHGQRFLGLRKWWELSAKTQCGLVVKSVYANVFLRSVGTQTTDIKLNGTVKALSADLKMRAVWSYSDSALKGGLLQILSAEFPKPSRFEVEGHEQDVPLHPI